MTNHAQIKADFATAIADSEEVRDYCVEHFGKPPLVIVDWFGANGSPGVKEAPFVFVYSADENEIGFVDEETFNVHVVVGGCDDGTGPTREVRRDRTDEKSGLVVNGIASVLEGLRNIVESIAESGAAGAVPRTMTRVESSTADYPLEWAKLNIDFYEPQTL